jgi:hypothetical protein
MNKKKTDSQQDLYGTKEVAQILGIPEWRVKNFSDGAVYRLPPTIQVGSGRGSRKLYDRPGVFRLGVADHLLKFGFAPESVGQAVREIPESVLRPYGFKGKDKVGLTPALFNLGNGIWRHRLMKDAPTRSLSQGEIPSLFVLNLAYVCDLVFAGFERYWAR